MLRPDIAEQARVRKTRAVELTAQGKVALAAKEYLAALELEPGDVYARERAAELFVRLGDRVRAVEQYLCLLGKYAVEGRILKAIATCHLVLQIDPAHGETLTILNELCAARDKTWGGP
jgi:hypothetical protein